MTLAIVTLALPTTLACGGESPVTPKAATLGQEFSLKPGEVALVAADGGSLEVGFESVPSDSRCPVDVTCVWEGEAVVKVWTRGPRDGKTAHELKTRGAQREVAFLGYLLRLTALAPQPRKAGRIDPKDYLATLVVARR